MFGTSGILGFRFFFTHRRIHDFHGGGVQYISAVGKTGMAENGSAGKKLWEGGQPPPPPSLHPSLPINNGPSIKSAPPSNIF